jgi:hypothetical protein
VRLSNRQFQWQLRPAGAYSFGLSATSQQYFSLRTNQPLATSQQYFSIRTNQHQPSATSRTNRLRGCGGAQSSHGEGVATRVALPWRHVGEHNAGGWVLHGYGTTSGEKIISFLAEMLSKLRFLLSFHFFCHHAT